MSYRFTVPYDTIHEMDDWEPGSVIGFHLEGHQDFQTVEEFLATGEVEDYGFDDIQDWDVTLTYVRDDPYYTDDGEKTDSWIYVYKDEPTEGYRPVTKIETAYITRYWCTFHPMEPCFTSVPADHFANETIRCVLGEELYPDSRWKQELYIHLCKSCHDWYQEAYRKAYDQALIEVQFENRQKELQNV